LAREIEASLVSLAAGTFLFVALVEIIPDEFATSKNKWTKVGLLLFGWTLMSLLALVA
jgi:zinc transporter 1/2/3